MNTNYDLDPPIALPGQLVDNDYVTTEFVCSEAISFGQFVELHTDGKLRPCQGTGEDIAKLVGVAVYKNYKEPSGYAAGDYVPVLRKGQIWALCVSSLSAQVALADLNVSHSSTVATNRGKLTVSVGSGVAGSEIDGRTDIKFREATTTNGVHLARVEINLP